MNKRFKRKRNKTVKRNNYFYHQRKEQYRMNDQNDLFNDLMKIANELTIDVSKAKSEKQQEDLFHLLHGFHNGKLNKHLFLKMKQRDRQYFIDNPSQKKRVRKFRKGEYYNPLNLKHVEVTSYTPRKHSLRLVPDPDLSPIECLFSYPELYDFKKLFGDSDPELVIFE